MKKILTLFIFLLYAGLAAAQPANDYFPSQTGFEWKFKVTPLDSLNNPLTSESVYRIDSFATVTDYNGMLSNIVPTKIGPLQTILVQPFTDSLFYHTEGTDGYEYFNISRIEEFLIELDSIGIDTNFSFLDFFTSLQDWYSVYRFAADVEDEYTLVSVDTTVGIYPLLFEYLGTRLDDENIQTVNGSFDCKKFLTQWKVSYQFLPPPFPPVELITTNDTIWIALDNWIVQDIIPSNPIDLSILGIPPFYIPGLETKETDEIVSVKNEDPILNTFILLQNYPNPFNPSTTIKYSIPTSEFVTLKVYDVLGNEVVTLVNEEKPTGSYEVEFDANSHSGLSGIKELSSGIYFYKLQTGSYVETKKMLLLR
jgi:hypothetical protein